MHIHYILRKSLILSLILSLIISQKAFGFDCLAPKIRIDQSVVKQEIDNQLILRNAIQKNLILVKIGACRTYSLNLSVLLFVYGFKCWIVVDENHVWVETEDYILDAYMYSNYKLISLEKSEPKVFAQWQNSGGVIAKQSNLAKRFYLGKAARIADAEFNEMLGNGFPYYKGFVPTAVEQKITNAYGLFMDEQAMERHAQVNSINQKPKKILLFFSDQAIGQNPVLIKGPFIDSLLLKNFIADEQLKMFEASI